MFTSRHRQRGYFVLPYLASLASAGATTGAAAAGGAAAGTVGAAVAGGASAAGLGAAATAGGALYSGLAAYGASKLIGQPKVPGTPAIPTIDQAAQQRQTQDRILARRGVLANIYSPPTAGAPVVGRARLLGGG